MKIKLKRYVSILAKTNKSRKYFDDLFSLLGLGTRNNIRQQLSIPNCISAGGVRMY